MLAPDFWLARVLLLKCKPGHTSVLLSTLHGSHLTHNTSRGLHNLPSQDSSPPLHPRSNSPSLAFVQFIKHIPNVPTSETLHLLFHPPWTFFLTESPGLAPSSPSHTFLTSVQRYSHLWSLGLSRALPLHSQPPQLHEFPSIAHLSRLWQDIFTCVLSASPTSM